MYTMRGRNEVSAVSTWSALTSSKLLYMRCVQSSTVHLKYAKPSRDVKRPLFLSEMHAEEEQRRNVESSPSVRASGMINRVTN